MVAINRRASFLPHRDAGIVVEQFMHVLITTLGAGFGQSTSLIVGLGDYIGGNLTIEDIGSVDIRYRPVEFDGLPFIAY